MAFTASEETILKQLIEAFQNGKRLSDLPNVKGTNPYELYVEVLDTDGESRKAALATLLPYIEEQCAYGIERARNVSTPVCTRVGNLSLHRSLPIQSRMRGVLLNDNGEVVEYLNPDNWTEHSRNGTRGQVMVEIPMHYRRFITDGNKIRVMLSEYPLPGYHQVPLVYVSAYETCLNRSSLTLASVATNSTAYRGGNNNTEYDSQPQTLIGRAASGMTLTEARTYARKRKAGSTQWNIFTYDVYKTIYWLYVVEYANLNSQAAYNAELTQDGYRQGGLGPGVTELTDAGWSAYNGKNPFLAVSLTDKFGNGSGIVSYKMPSPYTEPRPTVSVNRYRGIELPFGHLLKMVDGINVVSDAEGTNKVYVCSDPAKFSSSSIDNYTYIGNAAATGYIKDILFGETGCTIASEAGGTDAGSQSFFCDNHAVSSRTSPTIVMVCVGGNASGGATGGICCCNANAVPAYSSNSYGTRLCFIP